jgi:hypothetical protein
VIELSDTFSAQHLATVDDMEQILELMRRVFGDKSRVDLQAKKWVDHHPSMTLDDFLARGPEKRSTIDKRRFATVCHS